MTPTTIAHSLLEELFRYPPYQFRQTYWLSLAVVAVEVATKVVVVVQAATLQRP
jgi:hypothetical protein